MTSSCLRSPICEFLIKVVIQKPDSFNFMPAGAVPNFKLSFEYMFFSIIATFDFHLMFASIFSEKKSVDHQFLHYPVHIGSLTVFHKPFIEFHSI